MRHLILVLALVLLVGACGAKEDDDVIRQLIEKGAGLAEEKQVGDLMELTVDNFIATPGHRPAAEVKSILFAAFMHYGRFKIHYPKPGVDVSPDGDAASATVYFLIVRQNQQLPELKDLYENPRLWIEAAAEKADLYQLKLKLVKQKGDWLVSVADLQGFKGRGF